MESSNQFLGTERISKLMQKYAIPCIISLLVGADVYKRQDLNSTAPPQAGQQKPQWGFC